MRMPGIRPNVARCGLAVALLLVASAPGAPSGAAAQSEQLEVVPLAEWMTDSAGGATELAFSLFVLQDVAGQESTVHVEADSNAYLYHVYAGSAAVSANGPVFFGSTSQEGSFEQFDGGEAIELGTGENVFVPAETPLTFAPLGGSDAIVLVAWIGPEVVAGPPVLEPGEQPPVPVPGEDGLPPELPPDYDEVVAMQPLWPRAAYGTFQAPAGPVRLSLLRAQAGPAYSLTLGMPNGPMTVYVQTGTVVLQPESGGIEVSQIPLMEDSIGRLELPMGPAYPGESWTLTYGSGVYLEPGATASAVTEGPDDAILLVLTLEPA